MKLLIISCVFPPEPMVSARTSSDVAQNLASQGHTVQVITAFPNRPAGRLYEGYQRKLWSCERPANQYKVLRVFSFFSSQSRMLSRLLENLSFGIVSGLALLFSPKPDVVYANTWPIIAQGILALVCWLRGIPLVLSIQDLYPESLLVQSRMNGRRSWLFRILRWLDTCIAQSADILIVITKQFRQIYLQDRHLPPEKILVIPNWVDIDQLEPDSHGTSVRARHGVAALAFLVVYGGNVGAAAGVETLVEAWQPFSSPSAPYLLVAGSGSRMDTVIKLVGNIQARNVYFHSPWPENETSQVLAAADLLILPTQGRQSLVSVPSKLLTYMLAGRPILALALQDSEVAEIIRSSGCGWVIPPEDARALRVEILRISELSRSDLTRCGEAGRMFVLKHYSLQENLPKVINVLRQVGGGV